MNAFDPRVTPARSDLAAGHLRGKVEAARFVEGETREVIEPTAPLRRAPAHDAPLETEALMGERVTVYETTEEGWAWGQLADDGYVGWLPAGALTPPGPAPTHRISALHGLVFPGPSIKATPVTRLPFGARIAATRTDDTFAVTQAGFISRRHVSPLADMESDWVAVAERFLGAPYLWGGKTSLGVDCSGLVQVALAACGIACPRDSDMQERALSEAVGISALRRGDLVFWKGHVALARDAETLIHANAFHMAVASEPVDHAVARIGAAGSEVTSVKRLDRAI